MFELSTSTYDSTYIRSFHHNHRSLGTLILNSTVAILEECPGLVVEILVDYAPLPEYEDESEPSMAATATRYMHAQSGQEFHIRFDFSIPFPLREGLPTEVKLSDNCTFRQLQDARKPHHLPRTRLNSISPDVGST